MKMVILGAQAPKCDKKPQNPTSSSKIGTMHGTHVKGKNAARLQTAEGHR